MQREPLLRLTRSHDGIEESLGVLEGLARHIASRGCDGLAAAAAKKVLQFFDTTGARHHRDEDRDLFPFLRVRAGALGRPEIAAAIDELEREHATLESQWLRLREKLLAIAGGRKSAFGEGELERFAWLHRRHIDQESLLVLPFASEILTREERVKLGQRMDARRA